MDIKAKQPLRAELTDDLFDRWRRGEGEAMRAVVELFGLRLRVYLFACCGSHELSEDLGQEVFLLSYRKRDSIPRKERLEPWLFASARQLAWNAMKKKSYRVEFAKDPAKLRDVPEDGEQPQTGLLNVQVKTLLLVAINELNDRERDVVTLRFFGEHSVREISEITGIPMGSIGVTLGRALGKLREILTAQGIEIGDLLP